MKLLSITMTLSEDCTDSVQQYITSKNKIKKKEIHILKKQLSSAFLQFFRSAR